MRSQMAEDGDPESQVVLAKGLLQGDVTGEIRVSGWNTLTYIHRSVLNLLVFVIQKFQIVVDVPI